MAFKIKDGIRISTVDVFNSSGELLVNAPTASTLETGRTISLSGDATGSVVFDGSADVDIEVTIAGLDSTGGTPTLTGDIVGDIYASNGTSKILENGTNGTDAVFTGSLAGNADTATALETARTIELSGDVTGSVSFNGTADVNITATISANSVALGTDTTGNYVESVSVTAGTGLSVTGTGEGATVTLAGVDATTTTKGVASFSSDNFSVTSGAVSIKDGGVSNAELENSSVTIGTTEISLGATSTTLAGLTQVDIDNIRIDGNTISTTDTNGNLIIDPDGTGVINVSSTKITNLATPTENTDAATKEYVDTIASASLHYHDPVRVETPSSEGSLDAAYNNGTSGVGATLTANNNEVLVIDGVTLDLNDRVLVYNQTNAAHNGIYEVTTLGVAGTTPWVLTRTTDADSYAPSDPDALGTGDAFFVKEGNTGAGELYVMTTEGAITFGTTNITFSQINSSQIYIAGDALSLDGVTFNVNVDDSTIEISGDALRVKDSGITNAKLANDSITVDADSGTADPVALGETLTFVGGTGISTSVADNQITITNDDVGSSQDIVKSIVVTDTPGGGSYSETGTYTVSGNSDSLTFESGTGVDIDIDTTNGVLRFENTQQAFKTISVSGQSDVVADSINDTLTLIAGSNITIATNATNDSVTINATSSTSGDNAFDNITDTVATTSPTVIDSFAIATYRSAKYYIQISQGTDYQISELMVIHDGTTTYDTEFAVLETTGELGTLTTAINGVNLELSVTMGSATSASFVIKRILVEV